MSTLVLVATAAVTVYAGQYVGQPLYCDTWDTELFYDDETPPWAALPDSFWENGGECWDRIGLQIAGVNYYFYALDRMQYGDWYVVQPSGVWLPIAMDLPRMHAPFDGLSTVADKVWNLEPIRREWEKHRD